MGEVNDKRHGGLRAAKLRAQKSETSREIAQRHMKDQAGVDLDYTASEVENIAVQLGYVPHNLVKVAAYNESTGAPTVLLLYPIGRPVVTRRNNVDLQPFPTIFWLCCPKLRSDVSTLEARGFITEFMARLQADPNAMECLERQHQEYADIRWAMLTEEDKTFVIEKGWQDCLNQAVGVAGMRNPRSVKCLHAHYSHFLGTGSGGNIVGKWVQEALDAGLHLGDAPLNVKAGLQDLQHEHNEEGEEETEAEANEQQLG